ncbi:hypothetical protein LWS69_02945 [Bordetella hinzii]|nr:hypothetical protein [Bordetella hinzii]
MFEVNCSMAMISISTQARPGRLVTPTAVRGGRDMAAQAWPLTQASPAPSSAARWKGA